MLSLTFRVTGLVQGVGFRWSCQAEARRLGVFGWVSNSEEGSVAGFIQGQDSAVERMASWLRHGPPRARVDGLDLQDAERIEGLASFLVKPESRG